MTDAVISLEALFDLKQRLVEAGVTEINIVKAEHAVLQWVDDQGMLTPRIEHLEIAPDPAPEIAAPAPMPSHKNQPWTDEEDTRAIEMKRNGVSAVAIAEALGRSVPGTYFRLSNLLREWNKHTAKSPAAKSPAAIPAEPQTKADTPKGAAVAPVEIDDVPGLASPLIKADRPTAPAAASDPEPAPIPSRAGEPWTDEEDARAIEMKRDGMSARKIAEALGRPVQGTCFRLSKVLQDRIKQPAKSPTAKSPAAIPAEPQTKGDTPKGAAVAAPQFDPTTPLWFRQLDAVLTAIGYKTPWTPALDLELVEELARGRRVAEVAADMKIDAAAVKARWFALTPDGRPTITEQEQLLKVLRHRAQGVAQAAE